MLVNKEENNRVKFISYTGKWPCLCMGVLTLEIDGVQYKFGHDSSSLHFDESSGKLIHDNEDENNPNYDSFWTSGGECYFTNDYQDSVVESGEWHINVDDIPEKFHDVVDEIDKVFNDSVPWGCCGGCL